MYTNPSSLVKDFAIFRLLLQNNECVAPDCVEMTSVETSALSGGLTNNL
jgi:hypothetical protein